MATYTTNQTVAIPANAKDITVTVYGQGGAPGGWAGGTGGNGRVGVFSFPNFVARLLTLVFNDSGGAGGGGGTLNKDLFDYTSYPNAGACGYAAYLCGLGYGAACNNVNAGCCGSGNGCGQNNYVTVTDTGYAGGRGGRAVAVIDEYSNTYAVIAGGGGGGGGGKETYNWVYTFVPGTPADPGEYDYQNEYWIRFPTEGTPDETVRSGPSPSYEYGSNGVDAGDWLHVVIGQIFSGGEGTTSRDGGGGGGGGGAIELAWNGGGVRTGAGGGESRYNPLVCTLTNSYQIAYTTPQISIEYTLANPTIDSFSSSTAVGSTNTTLTWSTSNANSISINQGVGAVSGTSITVDTGLQSVVGSSSPATKTYTLTACFDSICVTRDVTAYVYNDQTPTDFTISNLSGREPNEENIIVFDGTISGIDMPIQISSIQGNCGFSVDNGSFVAEPIAVTNNQNLRIRTNALAFNTSPTGETNAKTCQIQVGTVQKYFTVTTRAPDVNETFDIADKINEWPFPKIDTTSNTPSDHIETPNTSVDDIDVSVEVKSNNPNVQVRINDGSWQDVRQL